LPVSNVEFARRVKKNVPADIVAAGKLNASITLQRPVTPTGAGPAWQGGGEVLALNVRSLLTIPDSRLTRFLSPYPHLERRSWKKPGAERTPQLGHPGQN